VRQSVRGSRRWPSRQYRDGLPRRACDLRKRDARRVRQALRDPPLLTLSPGPSIRRRSMIPRCLFDLRGSWQIRESNSRCSPAEPSGKVPDTHSVDSICDHDFGVFTVTNIATENTDAVLPAHPLPRTPTAANQGLQRCRGARVPLTCLAPLAAWQSLCTGHVDASLENSVALAFTDGQTDPASLTHKPGRSTRSRSLTPGCPLFEDVRSFPAMSGTTSLPRTARKPGVPLFPRCASTRRGLTVLPFMRRQ